MTRILISGLLAVGLAIGLVFIGPALVSDSQTAVVYAQTCGGDGDTDGGDDCENDDEDEEEVSCTYVCICSTNSNGDVSCGISYICT